MDRLFDGLVNGNRVALAKSITLCESSLPSHRERTQSLLSRIRQWRLDGDGSRLSSSSSFRIGISGPPGVGKSTFIERFGLHVVGQGHRVAVLAVDPSSVRTGGSVLGDKTRMTELSRHSDAYVRPSPTRGTLGGVTRHTADAIVLCEAAGYDVVLVETVGVGQSEIAVGDMVDMFALLANPAGGDEIQGIKKGIMELADIIVVTKADGDLVQAARRATFEYLSVVKLLHAKSPHWRTKVLGVSSKTGENMSAAWDTMREFRDTMWENGAMQTRRASQRQAAMWRIVTEDVLERLQRHTGVAHVLPTIEKDVMHENITPGQGADGILQRFCGKEPYDEMDHT